MTIINRNADPSGLFNLDEKITFGLSPNGEGVQFACLVKKIKGNLMAVVVSNRDKGKVNLSLGDEIFFYHDIDDEPQVTAGTLAQNNSFPLIIVNFEGKQDEPVYQHEQSTPQSIEGDLEPVDNDHLVPEPDEEKKQDQATHASDTDTWDDETPDAMFTGETVPNEDSAEHGVEDISDDELSDEDLDDLLGEDSAEGLDIMDIDLDEIPEIKTSDLEAELVEDLKSSLEQNRAPDSVELTDGATDPTDDIEDEIDAMELVELEDIEELDDLEEPGGPDKLEDVDVEEFEPAQTDEPLPILGPEPGDEKEPSVSEQMELTQDSSSQPASKLTSEEETVADHAGPGRFDDYFGFHFIVVGSETAEQLERFIKKDNSEQRRGLETWSTLDTMNLGEGISEGTQNLLKDMFTRVSRLERIAGRLFGGDLFPAGYNLSTDTQGEPVRNAVCLSIDKTGIYASIDGPLEDGAFVLLAVDRPWNPPLRFDTVAAVFEGETKPSGVNVCKFRFVGIHPDDVKSIEDYLALGQGYLERLRDVCSGQENR